MSILFFNSINNFTNIQDSLNILNSVSEPFLLILYSTNCPACMKIRSSIYDIYHTLNSDVFSIKIGMLNIDKLPEIIDKLSDVGITVSYVPSFIWIRNNIVKGLIKVDNIYENPYNVIKEILKLDNDAFGNNTSFLNEKFSSLEFKKEDKIKKKNNIGKSRYKTSDSVAQVANVDW